MLGLSLGGIVAQWMGIHTPDRIDRLVLTACVPFLPGFLHPRLRAEFGDAVADAITVTNPARAFAADWPPN